jgi:hypothetical protein
MIVFFLMNPASFKFYRPSGRAALENTPLNAQTLMKLPIKKNPAAVSTRNQSTTA